MSGAFKGDADWTDAKSTNKENMWDDNKLKLIEDSLGTVRKDTFTIRNDKYMKKEADDHTDIETSIDFDAASSEDIIGCGSDDEKFVIRGGIHPVDIDNGLNRIAKCIKGANKTCDSASDHLKSRNILGNAWDSTINFLKHPWASTHPKSIDSVEKSMEPNDLVPDSVNLTKNKTSSAWENSTHFVPGVANTVDNQNHEMAADIFERIGPAAPRHQSLVTTAADM